MGKHALLPTTYPYHPPPSPTRIPAYSTYHLPSSNTSVQTHGMAFWDRFVAFGYVLLLRFLMPCEPAVLTTTYLAARVRRGAVAMNMQLAVA